MVNQGNYATFAARFHFTHHLIKTKTHTSDLNQKNGATEFRPEKRSLANVTSPRGRRYQQTNPNNNGKKITILKR